MRRCRTRPSSPTVTYTPPLCTGRWLGGTPIVAVASGCWATIAACDSASKFTPPQPLASS